jgi:hypothetical protein
MVKLASSNNSFHFIVDKENTHSRLKKEKMGENHSTYINASSYPHSPQEFSLMPLHPETTFSLHQHRLWL